MIIPDIYKKIGTNTRIMMVGLFLLIIIAFFPAIFAGYIWDDDVMYSNPVVLLPNGIWQIWFSPKSYFIESHYWPVTYTSFWLEYRLWNNHPFGYHLVNILLHALNTFLLLYILKILKIQGRLFIAALFALHPVHVESVAWVIERKDVLSAFFYLSAALLFLKHYQQNHLNKFTYLNYFFSLVLFISAILSKSVTVTLPFVLLLILWWKNNRIIKTDYLLILPFFIFAFLFGYIDLQSAHYSSSYNSGLTWIHRFVLIGKSFWFYLTKLILPINLMTIYPKWNFNDMAPYDYIGTLSIISIITILFFLRNRFGKGILIAVLFYLLTLTPTLGFIDFSFMQNSYVADRFQYLASIGPIVLFVSIAAFWYHRIKIFYQPILQFIGILIIAIFVCLTLKQATLYKNNETLFRDNVLKNPNAWTAYYQLGLALSEKNQVTAAIQYYKKSIELNPGLAYPYNTLANLYLKEDKPDLAEKYYKRAIERDPNISEICTNLGVALAIQGKLDEAVTQFKKALQLNPNNTQAKYNLEKAYRELNTKSKH